MLSIHKTSQQQNATDYKTNHREIKHRRRDLFTISKWLCQVAGQTQCFRILTTFRLTCLINWRQKSTIFKIRNYQVHFYLDAWWAEIESIDRNSGWDQSESDTPYDGKFLAIDGVD